MMVLLTSPSHAGPNPGSCSTEADVLVNSPPTLETHKKRRTETPEVPSDLQDLEIPLEDMGDVIVLTGL